ncbi:MAG TPA: ribonuclease R [Candidatus Acidoferrales bacterium]|nr:ribonuclease R [Candidatus Acidoferrales bacterium]
MNDSLERVKQKVLSYFLSHPRQRLKPKEIQRRAGIGERDLEPVVEALRALVREGRLMRLQKNHYALPEGQNLIRGRVQAHPDGFGFLIPERKDIEDIYLSRREMRRVMHGDEVLVRLETRRHGRDAHVVQVIDRGQKRLVGTYQKIDGGGYVIPMDARVAPAIPLERTPEAVREGQVVAVELSRYPSGYRGAQAKLVRVLGDPDDPEAQAQSIIFRYRLPTEFSPESRRAAAAYAQSVDGAELQGREDLRSLPIVTIDGERARDFDDAVFVEKTADGYALYVCIADVAHYVVAGGPIDGDAYERGTSVYFPDRALPMLPAELSSGICSLNPGEDRLTKTVYLEINRRGEVIDSRFFRAVIRSHARMTYTDVRRVLVDNDRDAVERFRPLVAQFALMAELAELLTETRRARGSLDFDLPEAEIVLDLQGAPESIVRAERNIAHRIIEEFMIAANEAVARHLKERGLPFLYRVHEDPDQSTLRGLEPFLLSLGYRLPLKREKLAPKDLQRVLEACRGKPEERVLHRLLLRAMKQAHYAPENVGHFGLASGCYTHFTSPIRRYPDLTVHRALDIALDGKKLTAAEKDDLWAYLEEAGKHTSERERVAMDAEREMVELKKVQFMIDKIGHEYSGYIVALASFGFFVELTTYFVEGLVRLASLQDDSYHYYEKENLIKGRRHGRTFRMGDRVVVRVVGARAFRGEIEFALVASHLPAEQLIGRHD